MTRCLGTMRPELGLVLALLAGPSCSGTHVDDGGLGENDAGVTDGGGESGAGGSSSRPSARGGSNFAVTSSGCNVQTGLAIPPDVQPTSATYLGERVEDGVEGATVDCVVVTSADGFAFNGNVQLDSRAFTIIANVSPDGDGYTGTGTVWHTDPNGPALSSDDGGCTVTVQPNQDIAPGRVWGNFECPTVSASNEPGIACTARGSFVFENCDQ